jgi:hypothetical protein
VNGGAQSSSAQSEQLASTADELNGMAERLRQAVARFQLAQAGRASGAGAANRGLLELGQGVTPEMLHQLQEWLEKSPGAGDKRGVDGEGDGHGPAKTAGGNGKSR